MTFSQYSHAERLINRLNSLHEALEFLNSNNNQKQMSILIDFEKIDIELDAELLSILKSRIEKSIEKFEKELEEL